MEGRWRVDVRRFLQLMEELHHTQKSLRSKSGVSERTIQRLVSGAQRHLSDETATCLAQALGREPTDIGRRISDAEARAMRSRGARSAAKRRRATRAPTSPRPQEASQAPSRSETFAPLVPPVNAPAEAMVRDTSLLAHLAPKSPLQINIEVERLLPPLPLLSTPHGPIVGMSAEILADTIGYSRLREAERRYVTGRLMRTNGLTPVEGAVLGDAFQLAGRFAVVRHITERVPLQVTVHAKGEREMRRLLDLYMPGRAWVTLVVRIGCAKDDREGIWFTDLSCDEKRRIRMTDARATEFDGFELFWKRRAAYPFALVVEAFAEGHVTSDGRVVDEDGAPAPFFAAEHADRWWAGWDATTGGRIEAGAAARAETPDAEKPRGTPPAKAKKPRPRK